MYFPFDLVQLFSVVDCAFDLVQLIVYVLISKLLEAVPLVVVQSWPERMVLGAWVPSPRLQKLVLLATVGPAWEFWRICGGAEAGVRSIIGNRK